MKKAGEFAAGILLIYGITKLVQPQRTAAEVINGQRTLLQVMLGPSEYTVQRRRYIETGDPRAFEAMLDAFPAFLAECARSLDDDMA